MDNQFHPSHAALAKAVGVSRSTVSRALSDHPGTNEETKKLVREAATRLGYRKKPLVSMLSAQIRANRHAKNEATVAYLTTFPFPEIPKINATYHAFFEGAQERAEELGYGLDLVWLKDHAMTGVRMSKILFARGIQGLLVAPRPTPLGHISLRWSDFSTACIGHALPTPSFHVANALHHRTMDIALRMIRKHHYQRIGFAVGIDSDRFAQRILSSRFLLYQNSIPPDERIPSLFDLTINRDSSVNLKAFQKWYQKYRPEVIICLGSYVPTLLKAAGISVPNEVAYVDLCLSSEDGEQAGIFERPKVIAASAVDLVVEQIHTNHRGVPENPKSVGIEGKWVNGKTLPMKIKQRAAKNPG